MFSYFTTAIKWNGVSYMIKLDKESKRYEEFKRQLLERAAIEQNGYDLGEIQRRINDELEEQD